MKQYIDFFKTHRQEIDSGCPVIVNSYRDDALALLEEKGFPAYGSEDYRHIDIAGLLAPDFGLYVAYKGALLDTRKIIHCNIPNLSFFHYFIVNGHFYEEKTNKLLPEGVFSGSLNVFAEQYPDLFSKYYNKQALGKGDGLTAFNTLLMQDGYVLYVPKNVIIEDPIQLTNIANGKTDSLVNRRLLIIMEASSQAVLLVCDHSTEEDPLSVANQVTEIYVGDNAKLDFYELEESTKHTIRLTNNFVEQLASSHVVLAPITLSNGITRNNYRIDLDGEYAECDLYGMAIADDKQTIDNYSLINHHTPHCHSNELFKYVLDDEAEGVFSGKVMVAQNAWKTQAYQSNRNILGSKNCRMYSKPQLIINADDVKCSHGMTTGQLDEKALFYMRSRGISRDEAILLLKYAFTHDVIQGIRLESLRDRLRLLIEKRLRGELVKCQGCI